MIHAPPPPHPRGQCGHFSSPHPSPHTPLTGAAATSASEAPPLLKPPAPPPSSHSASHASSNSSSPNSSPPSASRRGLVIIFSGHPHSVYRRLVVPSLRVEEVFSCGGVDFDRLGLLPREGLFKCRNYFDGEHCNIPFPLWMEQG